MRAFNALHAALSLAYVRSACRWALLPLMALALLMPATPATLLAQRPTTTIAGDTLMELRLGDGSRTVGRVVEVREDQIVFETIAGVRMEVNRAFARLQPVRGRIVDGEFWREDKHTTRLFFAPTGRTLRAGEGYAGLFFILPFVGYGATDDVTLAGGMPLAGSLETIPFWVAPKVRVYNSPTSQVSTGVFAVHLPGETESPFVGIAYGVGSFGDLDNALHAGAGVSFGGDGTQLPLMVGGELRVSRRNKLISENWLIPGEVGAVSGGVRMMGERWTTDLGLMALMGDGTEIPYFPIVSFSYAFGSSR